MFIKKVSILAALTIFASLSGCLSSGGSDDNAIGGGGGAGGGNAAPTIGGSPASSVTVGSTYSFTPISTDDDGDSLTFSVSNLPEWADFNSATGSISGAPEMGDIGTYANISISVTDGTATAAMSSFSINVTQVAVGSTTLSWAAPTQNEDGSNLDDLAGYRIYYGTASGNYTNTIDIDNPSITTYVVENLSPGTHFFAAKAINQDGVESAFSGEATRTVN